MLSHYHHACAGPIPHVTFDEHFEGNANIRDWSTDQKEYVRSLHREFIEQQTEQSSSGLIFRTNVG